MIKIAFELTASALAISGQFLGSTTPAGSIAYAVTSACWIVWVWRYRQWGFVPATAFGTAISAWNLWAAL